MKVVLRQDVKGVGKKDQLVEVAEGYGRNFLLPRKLAVEANASAVNDVKNKESAKAHRAEVELTAAREAAERLSGKTVVLHAKAGAGGRLFGAVTAKDVAEAVQSQLGVTIDKRKFVLEGDIKSFGSYPVEVKLHVGVAAKLTAKVEE